MSLGIAAPPQAVSADIVATIGNTPLVELSGITPNPDVRMLGWLETPVAENDTLTILPAMAGGAGVPNWSAS